MMHGGRRRPKRTRRNVDSYTVGSHVSKPLRASAKPSGRNPSRSPRTGGSYRGNHAQVRISETTPRPTGAVDEINQIGLQTRSGESRSAYARRTQRDSFAEQALKRSRKRAILIAIVSLVVIAAAASLIGVFTFFKSTDQNLGFVESNASEALVAPAADAPLYILCTADLSEHKRVREEPENMAYMLVRADMASEQLTFLTFPAKLEVRMRDGEVCPLDEVTDRGGDAELIRIISALAGVDVNHMISTRADCIASMVEMLNGIHMEIVEEVDDPRAGTRVVMVGDESIDGDEALVVLRAMNFAGGFETTASNRVSFTMQLVRQALDTQGLDFAAIVGEASEYVSTDLSTSDLLSLGSELRPVDEITVYQSVIPYYESSDAFSDEVRYTYREKALNEMMERFRAGEDPVHADSDATSVEKGDVTVEVRNGTLTNGAGARLAESLEGFGYRITDVGNTDDGVVYPETLIVYTSPEYEGAAKAIIRDMGAGRAVNGGDYYTSQADVIAIIGKDWMPS